MSDAEAIQVVHGMMAAREREEARAAVAAPKYDAGAARRKFWKEVAVYPLTLVGALVYTLLMTVLQ